jgi:hypothetical protein
MTGMLGMSIASVHASIVSVANASFEDTPATQATTNGALATTGWTAVVTAPGPYGNYTGSEPSSRATDGTQIGFANDPGTGLYQDLGAIQPNTDYHVTVALGSPNAYPTDATAALLNGTNNTGTYLGSVTNPANNSNVLTDFSFDVTTSPTAAGDLTIFLSNSSLTESSATGDGVQANFDNVRITATSVPEPASLAFMAVGGLALLARRRLSNHKS